jgi:hypothetical protein
LKGCIYSDRRRDQRVSFEAGLARTGTRGRAWEDLASPRGFGILHLSQAIVDYADCPADPPRCVMAPPAVWT